MMVLLLMINLKIKYKNLCILAKIFFGKSRIIFSKMLYIYILIIEK